MASPESGIPQQSSTSRRRGTIGNIKETATEDQALNEIAKEAEVRLAAKRAARAEARSIRMKEIEREQKEGDGDDDMAAEDTDLPKQKKSITRAATLRDREHISSASTASAYDVSDSAAHVTSDKKILELKGMVKEGEAKYKKAMVNAAQLDNERQALQYQVEILRDTVEELQESIANTDDELVHKSREYNKLNREYQNTTSELEKCIFLVKERERVLDENGINVDGTIIEGYGVQSSAAQCSTCSASLNDDIDTLDSHHERGSLLAEIASLRNELEDLKHNNDSEQSRNELESLRTEHIELDQSFADVSNEAAVIRDDALHTGLYVNNNEKNDDFEMIDNGSQQGGIRNFEDQSFEKSTSSLTSSMMTDAATSIESSLPLEINVDVVGKAVTKDDYDIVHVEDSTKPMDINVDSYTNLDYIPSISSSSGSTSNININKYLFDDHDDTSNDDNEQFSVFSVNRYFVSETASNGGTNKVDDNNELQTSIDTITNVQSDYDTIDTEDVLANADNQFACEENRDSPYEDVQEESVVLSRSSIGLSRPSDGMVIIEESKTLEKNSFDETSVESSDITLLNGQSKTTVEVISLPQNVSIERSSSNDHVTDLDMDLDEKLNDHTPTISAESQNAQSAVSICPSEAKFSKNLMLDESGGSENDLVTVSSDSSLNTAFCVDDADNDDKLPVERNETIRNDVEELYNQIATETNECLATTDGQSDMSESNMTARTLGGNQGQNSVVSDIKGPEILIVDTEPTVSTETIPKAKERKSKKKKSKKGDKVTNVHVHETEHSTVVPSDPLLLGFATESDSKSQQFDDNPTEKYAEKPVRPKSDIPKQFLDASADLIGSSSSDISDLEDGYISEDGKRKSSKRSKKEGCKSQ